MDFVPAASLSLLVINTLALIGVCLAIFYLYYLINELYQDYKTEKKKIKKLMDDLCPSGSHKNCFGSAPELTSVDHDSDL